MSCHMSISFRPFVPFCEQKTIQKSVSGTKFFLRPGLLVSLWPVCNDSQCFHIHHYHPAENITPDWSFYILWCIGINGKFDLCSVFLFLGLFTFKLFHWVKHTDKKMCIFCQKCVDSKIYFGFALFQKEFWAGSTCLQLFMGQAGDKRRNKEVARLCIIFIYTG